MLRAQSIFILMTVLVLMSCKSTKQEEVVQSQTPKADKLITEMDKNDDNKLSFQEVRGLLAKEFAEIDTNSDGFLSKVELEKAPRKQRQQNRKYKGQGK